MENKNQTTTVEEGRGGEGRGGEGRLRTRLDSTHLAQASIEKLPRQITQQVGVGGPLPHRQLRVQGGLGFPFFFALLLLLLLLLVPNQETEVVLVVHSHEGGV